VTDTIPVPGGHVAYTRTGAGPAVVFLHGGALDLRMWEEQVPALAVDHTVVRLDARGHGRSSTPAGPFRQCDDVAAAIRALDLGPAVLVGLSMGAAAAIDTALEHPGLVRGLVACGAGASRYAALGQGDFRDPWMLERFAELDAAAQAWDAETWIEVYLRTGLVGPHRAVGDVDPQVVARCREMVTHTVVTHVRPDGTPPTAVADAPERIGEIAVPVLGAVGTLDSPDHLRMVRELVDGVPGATFAAIDGTAHVPNMERPAEFNAILRSFLTTVAERSRSVPAREVR
jgi:pimeloyl-ACP methyl ester carboxylesterase